jgi:hypothetical protein
VLTVGLDAAAVENDLCAGLLGCPATACGSVLGPWGWGRERVIRGAGGLRPRRGRCRGCRRTQVLLPVSVLLRRADPVMVIGAALVAKADGRGHRTIAALLNVPPSTVRGWLRRIALVAPQVLAVLAAVAAELGTDFTPPAVTVGPVAAVVELLGALAAAAARQLGGSCSPWRLAAVLTEGRLLAPTGPELFGAGAWGRNTNSLWAAAS